MANRRTLILITAGAALVAAGLVVGGIALTNPSVFGGGESEAIVEDQRWGDISPGNGPDTSVERDQTGIERDTESGEPSLDGVCWVYSGGGWLGGPCPTAPAD